MILQILNDDAALNTFQIKTTRAFVAGEDISLVMRLFQDDKGIRYIPDAGAIITIDLKKSDTGAAPLAKVATQPFADDRSIIQIDITAAESADLISQDLLVKIVEAGRTKFACKQGGLQRKVVISGC